MTDWVAGWMTHNGEGCIILYWGRHEQMSIHPREQTDVKLGKNHTQNKLGEQMEFY